MSLPKLTPDIPTWLHIVEQPERHWSPFDIRLMLHFYTGTPENFEQAHAPIYLERVQSLESAGLIEPDSGIPGWSATDRGRALVAMWCETPIPVIHYIDPRLTP